MTVQRGQNILYLGSDRLLSKRLQTVCDTLGFEARVEQPPGDLVPHSLSSSYIAGVVDCSDRDQDSTELVRNILSESPSFPVLILSSSGHEKEIINLLGSGIASYLVKDGDGVFVGLIAPMITHLIERSAEREKQLEVERQNSQRQDRATRFNSALADLIKCKELRDGDAGSFAKRVTELLSRALQTQRVSIWSISETADRIRCTDLWDSKENGHSFGVELSDNDCPSYFKALLSRRVLVFDDVYECKETVELAQAYLPSHDISSMLDTPIMKGGEVAGVLCLEHTGPRRDWTLEEQAFCISVADLVSMVDEIGARIWVEGRLAQVNTALAESETRYRRATRIARIGHWIWDEKNDRMAYASQELADIYGVSVEEYLARTTSTQDDLKWYHPDDRAWYLESIQKAAREKRGYDVVARIVRDDGSVRYLHEITEAILDKNGALHEIVGILQDVTEQRILEMEREAARLEAERANQAKSDFLAAMSHEFRTPLNAIIGFSDLIQQEVFGAIGSEKYTEYVENILDSGKHMLALVEDVLDISTIEAGRQQFDMVDIDIPTLFAACQKSTENQAKRKKITVSVDISGSPTPMHADERAMRQVLLNLLDNAIKFTPQDGTVMLSYDRQQDLHRILVRDSGPGIPADKTEVVTDAFVQLDDDPLLRQDGLGLGLAIVRELIDAHGGELNILSPEGGGALIEVLIPVQGFGNDLRQTRQQ